MTTDASTEGNQCEQNFSCPPSESGTNSHSTLKIYRICREKYERSDRRRDKKREKKNTCVRCDVCIHVILFFSSTRSGRYCCDSLVYVRSRHIQRCQCRRPQLPLALERRKHGHVSHERPAPGLEYEAPATAVYAAQVPKAKVTQIMSNECRPERIVETNRQYSSSFAS